MFVLCVYGIVRRGVIIGDLAVIIVLKSPQALFSYYHPGTTQLKSFFHQI